MTSVATDIVGKRVTVSRWVQIGRGQGAYHPVIRGKVRGVASTSEATFTLLMQVEAVFVASRVQHTVDSLAVFVVDNDGVIEVLVDGQSELALGSG